MALSGQNLIGYGVSDLGDDEFYAVNPANGEEIDPLFPVATEEEVDRAANFASKAFLLYREFSAEQRACFLEAISDEIVALGDDLLHRASLESGLPLPRLIGERGRTVNQLKMFAALLRDGSWVDARIDTALPDRQPLPRPDLRRMLIGLGPVAVFGASNFPFAFSVAGGDTASALAAGCPVVVKAHPAHPGTSQMVGEAVVRAAKKTGMPNGVFSMLHGKAETGMALVKHPLIEAVGFTGSLRAGRALFDAASARPKPIPVYAEMGSVNPVFLLPGALKARGEAIANGYAASITMSVGQFCTNPGLAIGIASPELDSFLSTASEAIKKSASATMLTPGIADSFGKGCSKLTESEGVTVSAKGLEGAQGVPVLFSTDAQTFLSTHSLAEEVFGPSSLLVICASQEEMESVANSLEGQLTGTLQAESEDLRQFGNLKSILELKVGRLIVNGFPTGVEVGPTMQHGGPYPATTAPLTTSVGTAAIFRFARPVCYQNVPNEFLPVELQNVNIMGVSRLINGELTKSDV